MKNEFIKKLDDNEQILFYGIRDVSKTSKQYGRFLLIFIILLLFWILTIISIKRDKILDFKTLMIVLVLSILTICLIYGLIYNIFLKYKKENNEYFVTNKRIAIYSIKNGFRIEDISNIEYIKIIREKNNYGDIFFNFYANSFIDKIKNKMNFEGVENPRKIVALISDLNKKVHIYDDRPIVMGKKL